jgi:hypothetical protein
MNLKNFFKPSRLVVIILAILPVIALLLWVYLFADCFSCPAGPRADFGCKMCIEIISILQVFLYFSVAFYAYLLVALIFYLKRK